MRIDSVNMYRNTDHKMVYLFYSPTQEKGGIYEDYKPTDLQ